MKYLTKSVWIPPAPPKIAYFHSKPLKLGRFKTLRKISDQISQMAKLRLEWIIFYESIGKRNATFTAKRYRIISLRKLHMKYGKKKLKILYKKLHQEEISTWKIERVIRKHKLYPDKISLAKRLAKSERSRQKPKIRIQSVNSQTNDNFGFLWHVDSIIIWWYGERRVIFTAIEEQTKIGYSRIYLTKKSSYASDFLERLLFLVQGKVEIMHSDNGTEFAGNFERSCQTLGITQVYSRPHTPKDNPALERFNRTVQDEWLSLSEVGLADTDKANEDLSNWLVEYNNNRPHEGLAYQTPLEYAEARYFSHEVLPMWSARTRHCHKGKNIVYKMLCNALILTKLQH
jgi:hypothetical protein